MCSARPVLLAVLTVAFAAYGSDCLAMATPEQAMRCCRSMPCSSHGHHGRDCCKRMSMFHSPFVQPSVEREQISSHVVLADAAETVDAPRLDAPAFIVAAQCHAPPEPRVLAPRPIRI